MDGQNNPLILLCEAMKTEEDNAKRYEVLVATNIMQKLHLDQQLNEAFKRHSYRFMYASPAVPANLFITSNQAYAGFVLEMCQQLDADNNMMIREVAAIEPEVEEVGCNYLDIKAYLIQPLADDNFVALEEIEWLDATLKERLFAQTDDVGVVSGVQSKPLRTYLMIDADSYSQCGLMWPLDMIEEVPVLCMYKGQAAIDLKDHAPYLIDMTLTAKAYSDTTQVPDFHRKYFKECWDKQVGIFIRSTASMAEVQQHFRKMTKIQAPEQAAVFFNYHDPQVLRFLLPFVREKLAYVTHWFALTSAATKQQTAISYLYLNQKGDAFIECQTNQTYQQLDNIKRVAFTLDHVYQQMAEAMFRAKMSAKVQAAVLHDYGHLSKKDDLQQTQFFTENFDYALSIGLKSELAIGQYVASCFIVEQQITGEILTENDYLFNQGVHENQVTQQLLENVLAANTQSAQGSA
ncbi:MAG: hypothetical protein OFPII_12450 [Osedax symbiont Rs1]|nr:MAG: hypothetical protein OFPII_12450 [Osedax symbiont Rs1]